MAKDRMALDYYLAEYNGLKKEESDRVRIVNTFFAYLILASSTIIPVLIARNPNPITEISLITILLFVPLIMLGSATYIILQFRYLRDLNLYIQYVSLPRITKIIELNTNTFEQMNYYEYINILRSFPAYRITTFLYSGSLWIIALLSYIMSFSVSGATVKRVKIGFLYSVKHDNSTTMLAVLTYFDFVILAVSLLTIIVYISGPTISKWRHSDWFNDWVKGTLQEIKKAFEASQKKDNKTSS